MASEWTPAEETGATQLAGSDAQGGTKSQASPTCYNCGAFDHYVMSCPEPTRQMPAGLAAARAAQAAQQSQSAQTPGYGHYGQNQRPFKRQKTGPVVTKYPNPNAPPVVTRYFANGTPQYAGSPVAQYGPGMPPYQQQQFPQQQQQQQQQQYQQQYQQQFSQQYPQPQSYIAPPYGQYNPSYAQQAYPYPLGPGPQTYGQTGAWGAVAPHGGSPAYSHPPVHHMNQQYPSQYPQNPLQPPQFHGAPSNRVAPHRHPSFQGPSPPVGLHNQSSMQWGQSPSLSVHNPTPSTPHGPFSPPKPTAVPARSDPSSPASQQARATQAPDGLASVSSATQVWPSAGETSSSNQPKSQEEEAFDWDLEFAFKELPSTLVAATAMAYPLGNLFHDEKIPPPPVGTNGLTSRYVRMASVEVWTKHISKSLHWQKLKDDPAFMEIDWEAPLISIREVICWVLQREDAGEVIGMGNLLNEQSQTRSPSVKERQHSEADSQDVDLQSRPSRKRSRSDESKEDISEQILEEASINKQGSTQATHERQDSPTIERESTPFYGADDGWAPQPGEVSKLQYVEEPMEDPTEALLASLGVTGAPKPITSNPEFPVPMSTETDIFKSGANPSGFKQQLYRHSSMHTETPATHCKGDGYNTDGTHGHRNSEQAEDSHIPPPPPPPLRQGSISDPSSEELGLRSAWAAAASGEGDHEPGDSPLSPTSAELLGQIPLGQSYGKAQDRHRRSDDSTPRLKRRQPNVAAAYSRRW